MVYVQTWGTKLICVQHFKRTPMNMFMSWVDIKTNKESMIPTLTLTIQDEGIIQISIMETKHKLLLHHLTIGHRVFNNECNNHIKSGNKCHQPKIQVLLLKILLKPFALIQFNFNRKQMQVSEIWRLKWGK